MYKGVGINYASKITSLSLLLLLLPGARSELIAVLGDVKARVQDLRTRARLSPKGFIILLLKLLFFYMFAAYDIRGN